MKILLSLLALSFCSFAWGAEHGYDLQMELFVNEKLVSSPRMTLQEGKTSSITQNTNGKTTFIDVTAKESAIKNKKAIHMQFVIGTIDKNGKKTITKTANLITPENLNAQMTVDANSKNSISIGVTASRIAL